jgi:hypothetical protein
MTHSFHPHFPEIIWTQKKENKNVGQHNRPHSWYKGRRGDILSNLSNERVFTPCRHSFVFDRTSLASSLWWKTSKTSWLLSVLNGAQFLKLRRACELGAPRACTIFGWGLAHDTYVCLWCARAFYAPHCASLRVLCVGPCWNMHVVCVCVCVCVCVSEREREREREREKEREREYL